MKKRLVQLVLFCTLFFPSMPSCTRSDDVSAIRMLVEKGAALAQQHDIGAIMDLTTEDFLAMPGEVDRRAAKGILWRAFRYYGELRVLYPQPGVTLEKDRQEATAVVPFLIVTREETVPALQELYKDPLRWMEEAGKVADLYRFRLQCIKVNGRWFIKRALLEKFKGLGFAK